jgi:hypothetical protein
VRRESCPDSREAVEERGFSPEIRTAAGSPTLLGRGHKTFPPGGYTTSVYIYHDISAPYITITWITPTTPVRLEFGDRKRPTERSPSDFVFQRRPFTTVPTRTVAGPEVRHQRQQQRNPKWRFPKKPRKTHSRSMSQGWLLLEHSSTAFRTDPAECSALTDHQERGRPAPPHVDAERSDRHHRHYSPRRSIFGWFVINEFPYLASTPTMLVDYQDFCRGAADHVRRQGHARGWKSRLRAQRGPYD